MKVAEIKKIEIRSAYPELKEISVWMDKRNEKLMIDTINWKGYD